VTEVSRPSTAGPRTIDVPRLEARDVTVKFGGIIALDSLSLSVSPGECVGLIGPNGAGKTTFLDCLSGHRPANSGVVLLDGSEVTSRSATWLAKANVRRTFQRTQCFGWLSVEENIAIPLELVGRYRYLLSDLLQLRASARRSARVRDLASEVIHRCGLSEVKDTPAASLPIGLLRMLDFARAVVGSPSLLLLDEPTSGTGKDGSERLAALIKEMTAERECSIVLVEHDVEFVMNLCDRIIVLDQGTILSQGTPAEVRHDPAVMAAYIGKAVESDGS